MIIYSLTYAINALSTAVKKKDEKILRIIVVFAFDIYVWNQVLYGRFRCIYI